MGTHGGCAPRKCRCAPSPVDPARLRLYVHSPAKEARVLQVAIVMLHLLSSPTVAPLAPGAVQVETATPPALLLMPMPQPSRQTRRHARLLQDEATGEGRGEFYLSMANWGMVGGIATLRSFAHLSPRKTNSALIAPVAIGAALAFVVDAHKPRLRAGILAGVDIGLLLGLADGLAISQLVHGNIDTRRARTGAWMWGGMTIAGLGGGLLAHAFEGTRGDVSLVGSGALWGGVAGLLLPQVVAPGSGWATGVLTGSLVGTALGAGLAALTDVSRAHMLFVDLGALAGLGVASTALLPGGEHGRRFNSAVLLAGEILGIGCATVLTRQLDIPLQGLPVAMQLSPTALSLASSVADLPNLVPGLQLSGRF